LIISAGTYFGGAGWEGVRDSLDKMGGRLGKPLLFLEKRKLIKPLFSQRNKRIFSRS
jgi:hypothetical protein